MIGSIVGGFIVILIGVTLLPMISNEVQSLNATGTAGTILGLTTLFFALGIVSAGIAVAYYGLKVSGLIGEEEEEDVEEDTKEEESHEPRNYLEYVKERVKAEEIIRKGM